MSVRSELLRDCAGFSAEPKTLPWPGKSRSRAQIARTVRWGCDASVTPPGADGSLTARRACQTSVRPSRVVAWVDARNVALRPGERISHQGSSIAVSVVPGAAGAGVALASGSAFGAILRS